MWKLQLINEVFNHLFPFHVILALSDNSSRELVALPALQKKVSLDFLLENPKLYALTLFKFFFSKILNDSGKGSNE